MQGEKNWLTQNFLFRQRWSLTDAGEDSKLVHRRKRPKVDTLFSSLFADTSERRVWLSAESKILASTFGRFRMWTSFESSPASVNSQEPDFKKTNPRCPFCRRKRCLNVPELSRESSQPENLMWKSGATDQSWNWGLLIFKSVGLTISVSLLSLRNTSCLGQVFKFRRKKITRDSLRETEPGTARHRLSR